MKILIKFFILFFPLITSNLMSNDLPKKNIAVLGFSSNSLNKIDLDIITSRLTELLVKSGLYKVIERNEIKKIIDEQVFQHSGVTSSDAVKFGRILNVNLILLGTLESINNKIIINSKIIDVETAIILNNQSMAYKGDVENFYNDGITKHVLSLINKRDNESPKKSEKPELTSLYFNFTQNENKIKRLVIYIDKKIIYDNVPHNGTLITKNVKNGSYSLRYKCFSSFGIPNIPAPLDIRSITVGNDKKIIINLNAIFNDDDIRWKNSLYKE